MAKDELADLLSLAAGGDQEAFMEFYDQTCPMTFGYLLAVRSGDREAAAQVTERTYSAAWAQTSEGLSSGLSPLAWLLALARRISGGPREEVAQ